MKSQCFKIQALGQPDGVETWLPVSGYERRYEVSDLGRVKSLAGEILKPVAGSKGCLRVELWENDLGKIHRVSRLVFDAFTDRAAVKAKFSDQQIGRVFDLRAKGYPHSWIARIIGCSQPLVSRVLQGPAGWRISSGLSAEAWAQGRGGYQSLLGPRSRRLGSATSPVAQCQ